MSDEIAVPASLWDEFNALRTEMGGLFNCDFAAVVRTCLRTPQYRRVGEWICDDLQPLCWRLGIEKGFRKQEA
jgi:Leu/Phe-tRNA-protein transferase